ncbi:MAG: gamma-glutamyltransferase [Pseudomonadota bacterium]
MIARDRTRRFVPLLVALALGLGVPAGALAQLHSEGAKPAAVAGRHMAAAANPIAAAAGRDILRLGGSALDAAIAIQMVLTLVEPQSSGIGGGAFLVHYEAASRGIVTYDGRETAPKAAGPDLFLDRDGKPLAFAEASVGGIAVGAPGVLRMLEMAHREHGRLPWARLFEPAIRLAEEGFAVSPRLNGLIAGDKQLRNYPAVAAYFHDADGRPLAVGSRLVNPALAATLRQVASGGAEAFYSGDVARDIVVAVETTGERPGRLSTADLAAYRAIKRDAVCGPYRAFLVCGMGPPSSGGVAVVQALGLLEAFDLASLAPGSLEAVHLISEASRLVFADRARYLADGDFVAVPLMGLVDRRYLAARAHLMSRQRSMGRAEPGEPEGRTLDRRLPAVDDDALELPATSHISVVDAAGNALAMTTSIENAFGSRVFVRGFLLNNQLTDFAFRPTDGERPAANRVEPGKRPRSSMSPTIVTDRERRLVLTLGSPGGARIIPYVVQTLVAMLDWGLDIQAAIGQPRHVNLNGTTELERDTGLAALAPGLRALGHGVETRDLASGLQGIAVIRLADGARLVGGADPRREGVALGD